MQRFAVIGLGRFGSRLAKNLAQAGQEVIAIDRLERRIEDIRDAVTVAVALDATDERAMRMQDIEKVDAAIVGIGENFESSALCIATLKQIGVPRVIGRAMTPTATRILFRIGADEVVNSDEESADRWALRLINPQFLDQFELAEGYSMVEIRAPQSWIGQTLLQIRPRNELGIHVVAIKRQVGESNRETLYIPMPDVPFVPDDLLLLMGRNVDLARLPKNDD